MTYPERPECDFDVNPIVRCANCNSNCLSHSAVKATLGGVERKYCSEHCANNDALNYLGGSGE